MSYIPKTDSKAFVISIVFLIVLGLYFWFEWRPSNIKKECSYIAKEKAIEKGGRTDGKYRDEDREVYYKWCILERGL